MNLQKLISPTVQCIIANSSAAPNAKKIGRNRYTPKYSLPGILFSSLVNVRLVKTIL